MILRSVVLPVCVVTAVCAVVAGLGVGGEGALGAVLGGLLVVLFLASSPWMLGPVARKSPALSLPFALALFGTKIIAAIVALYVLVDPDGAGRFVDSRSLGATAIVASVTCTTLQIRAFRRSRIPTYDLGNTP
ncbi:hypothetical protein ACHAAC_15990 [Aeromicrobium sp. CF4.19]|uniref:hypothetical protein n=1 Tax=Aeromicrobium sp. CF4.19 TaxID=3373082 RepID=UPI003EE56212